MIFWWTFGGYMLAFFRIWLITAQWHSLNYKERALVEAVTLPVWTIVMGLCRAIAMTCVFYAAFKGLLP